MPDSQFGHSPGTLAATLDELVALARALRAQPDRVPASLTRLEGLCKMLDYFVAPQIGLSDGDGQRPIYLDTHCSWHSCVRTWRDHDACLLNFAPRGEPPVWLCRDHHPPPGDGGIRPPGYVTDEATRESVESARRAALARLSRDELRAIIPRAGG
jgi:hypothetical protein